MASARVFAVLTGLFLHPKDNSGYPVVIVNRKMFMPKNYMPWQGKVGLFGGGVEAGETALEALRRELSEELPGFVIPEIEERDLLFTNIHDNFKVYQCELGCVDQSIVCQVAGACQEGLVDVLDQQRLLSMSPTDFIYPAIYAMLKELV